MKIVFTWEFLPTTVNKMYRSYGRQHRVPSPEYKEFLGKAAADLYGGDPCPWEWVAVTVELWPATRGKFDVDNRMKTLLDVFTKCQFWGDDECVTELRVVRRPPTSGGRTRVTIEDAEVRYRPADR